jgi:hypothetical protein
LQKAGFEVVTDSDSDFDPDETIYRRLPCPISPYALTKSRQRFINRVLEGQIPVPRPSLKTAPGLVTDRTSFVLSKNQKKHIEDPEERPWTWARRVFGE